MESLQIKCIDNKQKLREIFWDIPKYSEIFQVIIKKRPVYVINRFFLFNLQI